MVRVLLAVDSGKQTGNPAFPINPWGEAVCSKTVRLD